MFFIDMQLSSKSAFIAINNISQGTNILRTANRISFRFSELFTFLRYPNKFWINDARLMTQSELDNFHIQNKDLTLIIKSSWDILYLDHSFVDVYEDMDNIIFPSRNNCSIYINNTKFNN
ncbi:predicted protein [Naegleria gruberi]|uniref:Predicted protein n=1 Tax=Naegleria gruberi TaxID=5762 RepID=D2W5D8_NAEGR|nr:uncharacterized protein NAEGRDRAFT_76629 [Naegleria gruberi]EFC35713.1 predicted protein [Naegleria gruberi]|eukprot:XP_002668457.1 predicted protein [Naegleria gruberi strain NEG-M]